MSLPEERRAIEPTPERIEQLLTGEDTGAIVMVNLLRYREQAAYPPGFNAAPCTGREAYQRYAAVALAKVAEAGGRVVWAGQSRSSVIAPAGEQWDDVVLVEYPSRSAFVAMVQRPDYLAVTPHRTAALADSRLIETTGQLGAPGANG